MALVPWRPMGDLFNVQREVNRMFDELWGRRGEERDLPQSAWVPEADICETENEVIISADLPGMNKEDIKISVQNNVLTFSGEKRREHEAKELNYYLVERSYGHFSRSFTLPATVKADAVKASYKDGVLRLTLPKVEEARPKLIAVEAT